MARHRQYYFYCPHCRRKIDSRSSKKRVGSPLMKCSHCGKPCMDSFAEELAFHPFLAQPKNPWAALRLLLPLIFFVAAAIFFGWLAGYPITVNLTAVLILLLLCLLVFGYCLVTWEKSEQKRFDKWMASNRQMHKPNYACLLHNFGFPVPPYYLPSFSERTQNPVHIKAALIRYSGSTLKVPCPKPSQIDSWTPGDE